MLWPDSRRNFQKYLKNRSPAAPCCRRLPALGRLGIASRYAPRGRASPAGVPSGGPRAADRCALGRLSRNRPLCPREARVLPTVVPLEVPRAAGHRGIGRPSRHRLSCPLRLMHRRALGRLKSRRCAPGALTRFALCKDAVGRNGRRGWCCRRGRVHR